jgi:hypothetical protein
MQLRLFDGDPLRSIGKSFLHSSDCNRRCFQITECWFAFCKGYVPAQQHRKIAFAHCYKNQFDLAPCPVINALCLLGSSWDLRLLETSSFLLLSFFLRMRRSSGRFRATILAEIDFLCGSEVVLHNYFVPGQLQPERS